MGLSTVKDILNSKTVLVMTSEVVYIDGHVFIDGVFGKVASKGYFNYNHPNCPFALKVTLQLADDKKKLWG